jgi:hypothetical protein
MEDPLDLRDPVAAKRRQLCLLAARLVAPTTAFWRSTWPTDEEPV